VTLPHILLALAAVTIWGTNFAIIKIGLEDLPPLLFAALRFTFVLFPLVFFIKRPPIRWTYLAGYGLFIGAGQFGLLFYAMTAHISAGLTSLIIQSQVFFTIALAMIINREKIGLPQIVALTLGAAGVAVIIFHTDGTTTPVGLALVLLAGFCWGCGNMFARAAGKVDALGLVVWAGLFSAPPLFLASLIFEGWPAIVHGVSNAGPKAWLVVAYQSIGNALFGYGAWAWLLARYPAATVSPIALLVPVVGMATAAVLLGEALPLWKLEAAALVLTGLAINFIWKPKASALTAP